MAETPLAFEIITFVVLGLAKWLTERSAMRAGN